MSLAKKCLKHLFLGQNLKICLKFARSFTLDTQSFVPIWVTRPSSLLAPLVMLLKIWFAHEFFIDGNIPYSLTIYSNLGTQTFLKPLSNFLSLPLFLLTHFLFLACFFSQHFFLYSSLLTMFLTNILYL